MSITTIRFAATGKVFTQVTTATHRDGHTVALQRYEVFDDDYTCLLMERYYNDEAAAITAFKELTHA